MVKRVMGSEPPVFASQTKVAMRITIETEEGGGKKEIRVRHASLESKVGVGRVKQNIEAYSFIEGDFTRCELCEVIWDDAEVNECEDGHFRCPDCRANTAGVCEQVGSDGAGP